MNIGGWHNELWEAFKRFSKAMKECFESKYIQHPKQG